MPNPHLVLSCRFTAHGNQTIRREIRQHCSERANLNQWRSGVTKLQLRAGRFFFSSPIDGIPGFHSLICARQARLTGKLKWHPAEIGGMRSRDGISVR